MFVCWYKHANRSGCVAKIMKRLPCNIQGLFFLRTQALGSVGEKYNVYVISTEQGEMRPPVL